MSETIEFTVSVAPKVQAGDKVILSMILTNEHNNVQFVNTRFAVVPQTGDVWLEIKHEGEPLAFGLRIRLIPIKNSDFLKLEPGESVVASFPLSKAYQLSKPGRYDLGAKYVNKKIPKELENFPVFTGSVHADPTFFIVK